MLRLKALATVWLAAVLAACGGGGGSPGVTPGGNNGGGTTPPAYTMTLDLIDASGAASNAISAAGLSTAKVTIKSSTGAPASGALVSFAASDSLVRISPATTALTDANGVASVQITAASLAAAGAGTLSTSATVSGVTLGAQKDFQIAAANLSLGALDLGSGPLPAFGNRPIAVTATINGAAAVNTPVQVTFTASCGTINPSAVTTDATGKAATTYKADSANCSGSNVTISAAAIGAPAVTGTIAVQPALATNVQFVTATPQLIYLTGSVGATQAQVNFRVVDSTGNALQNQPVQLALVNSGPGVSLNTLGNITPVTLTTDASGVVSVAVFSGTVPTSLQVRATLLANTNLTATSNTLTVASGRAVQSSTSLARSLFSIEGFNVDGATSNVTISLADRQGNPVPDGTEVNFVSESGVMIPPRCVVTGGSSRCSVQIRSQGSRPANGRVDILAYVPGEEDFVDANFNNVYDAGEVFTDLGNAYRDDNETGTYSTGEFTVPRAGSTTCAGGINGRPNTCDGVWGPVDVRAQTMVVFATSSADLTPTAVTTGQIDVLVADRNGNSMPTNSTITAEKISGSDECTVKRVSPSSIPNVVGPTFLVVTLDKCVPNDRIFITVTSPGGIQTTLPVSLPAATP